MATLQQKTWMHISILLAEDCEEAIQLPHLYNGDKNSITS